LDSTDAILLNYANVYLSNYINNVVDDYNYVYNDPFTRYMVRFTDVDSGTSYIDSTAQLQPPSSKFKMCIDSTTYSGASYYGIPSLVSSNLNFIKNNNKCTAISFITKCALAETIGAKTVKFTSKESMSGPYATNYAICMEPIISPYVNMAFGVFLSAPATAFT
jgi:hypothetical protein